MTIIRRPPTCWKSGVRACCAGWRNSASLLHSRIRKNAGSVASENPHSCECGYGQRGSAKRVIPMHQTQVLTYGIEGVLAERLRELAQAQRFRLRETSQLPACRNLLQSTA